MKRLVTEQFIDLLRRAGKPTDQLTKAGPLPDGEVSEKGYSILRQRFEASYEDGTTEKYMVVRGQLRLEREK